MNRNDLLSIHQFAQVCRTTSRTIRFYDQKGLLKPVYIDPFTKYRYYEKEEQPRQFLKLRLLQNFHVSLKDMKEMVDTEMVEKSLDIELEKRKEQITEQEKEYSFLREMKRFLYDQEDLEILLKTETIGPFTILSRRFPKVEYEKTYLYSQETQKDAEKFGINIKDEYIMLYETRYYKPKASFVEIWQICADSNQANKKISPEYTFMTFPKTRVLTYTYRGPFTYFMLLYKKLNDYIDEKKLIKGQTSFDYYQNYQINTRSEYDYLTKICFPLE